jgi:hypothetical protein
MPPERPLPVETLLPFEQRQSPDARPRWKEVQRNDSNDVSQSPESQDDDEASETDKPKRQKRSRACVACRNMKIRCLPVEGQEACRACGKVNRQCVMPGPPRKRQKTVHKVAELEKKINALTDALLAKQAEAGKADDDLSPKDAPTNSSSEPARSEETAATSVQFGTDNYPSPLMERPRPQIKVPHFTLGCEAIDREEPYTKDDYIDVVDRGDLTMESAAAMFNYWRDNMCRSNPTVIFPQGTDPNEVRRLRPMTFLTILSVAAGVIQTSAHPALLIEVNRQLGERVFFQGDKSLDLVQALLLNSQWYVRPRTARDLAFNQNIQAACTMALELGIGKRSKLKRTHEEEVELSRTWLACYQCSVA